jgi:hypothetical protein
VAHQATVVHEVQVVVVAWPISLLVEEVGMMILLHQWQMRIVNARIDVVPHSNVFTSCSGHRPYPRLFVYLQ